MNATVRTLSRELEPAPFTESAAVALWCFAVHEVEPAAALATLNADERERAASFPERRRTAFVAVRASLRRALAAFGASPHAALLRGACGKPVLPRQDGLAFNVSHAAGWAAIAVARGSAVGVDIAAAEAANDLDALAERFFAARERAALRAGGALDARRFFETWTRREAVLKAVGLGLGPRPDAFAVSVPPAPPAIAAVTDARFAEAWALERFEIGEGIVGTLAVAAPSVSVRRVDAPPG